LYLDDGRVLIDGISSWWSAIHGYCHPELDQALKDQVDKMSHVMLGGLTHDPALKLAEKLVEITPPPLQHVFFSDSGSVGMEVAIKMAIQYWRNRGYPNKNKFVSLRRAYHGDTCGVIGLGDPQDGMHASFASVFREHYFLPAPNPVFEMHDLDEMRALFQEHHAEIAAFVVEPLMQGAGGFHFYPPAYLNEASKLCKQYGILFIFDEVATGFGRTGTVFAMDQTEVVPDILVLGKALTAGYTGQAATMTTEEIFDAFYSDDTGKAFMHGPTFMGNPLACAVALKSIEIFFREDYLKKIKTIYHLSKECLHEFDLHAGFDRVLVHGGVSLVQFSESMSSLVLQEDLLTRGVFCRPIGKMVYLAVPYVISADDLGYLLDAVRVSLQGRR
jgi:adenosylmethionine-8-amino-7-oxononanoate aminotransferase